MPQDSEFENAKAEDLGLPEFNAVWKVIRDWDIQRKPGESYGVANGNDVMLILDAIRPYLREDLK